jgi:hypothetical protein
VNAEEFEATRCSLNAEIETLKFNNQLLATELSHSAQKFEELSSGLEAEKAECSSLMQQLLEKDGHCQTLAEQMKTLNERLEALDYAHNGTSTFRFLFISKFTFCSFTRKAIRLLWIVQQCTVNHLKGHICNLNFSFIH